MKTHCKRGHPLNEQTTYPRKGKPTRRCRQCAAHYNALWYLRKNSGVKIYPKSHCKWGHALEGSNVRYRKDGKGRYCFACLQDRHVQLNAKRKCDRRKKP